MQEQKQEIYLKHENTICNIQCFFASGVNESAGDTQCLIFYRLLALHIRKQPSGGIFLGIGALKICSKFTGGHSYRSAISIKLLCNFIEIALLHGCSPENLLHIFRTLFPKNTFKKLLLHIETTKESFFQIISFSWKSLPWSNEHKLLKKTLKDLRHVRLYCFIHLKEIAGTPITTFISWV